MDEMLERVNNLTQEEIDEYSKYLMPNLNKRDGWHIKSGKGVWLTDINGKEYLDFTSQFFTNYVGYGNEEIAGVIADQAKNITYVGQFTNTNLRFAFAQKVASIAPKNLNRIAVAVGGGPAVELAVRIALKNRKDARNVICLWDAYHGNSFETLGATFVTSLHAGSTLPPAEGFTNIENATWNFMSHISNNYVKVPNAYCYRCPFRQDPENCNLMCAEMLRLTIEKGVVGPTAAVIVEPIQSGGGQIPLPKKYLQRVREICDEFGVILIFDEVQTYGKTGKFFASEYYGVEPDIIVTGKGIGGGMPVALIIAHDRLEVFEGGAEDISTYTNNQVSLAAALKSIEIIQRDRLLENCTEIGGYIVEKLDEMRGEFPEIGDIRGVGLLIGVELVRDPKTKEPVPYGTTLKILEACRRKGLLFQIARENVIKIKPGMVITREEADIGLNIFREAFREVLRNP